MKEILYVLLDSYADHEMPFMAMATNEQGLRENPKYANKIVAPTTEPVKSVGGCRMMPDYSFDTMLFL